MSGVENSLTFDLCELIEVLDLDKQKEILSKNWNTSCESYHEEVFFLRKGFIESYQDYFSFPDDVLSVYTSTVDVIKNNKHLKILAWHLHQILFNYGDAENAQNLISDWPCLESSMGELSDMFGVVVFASGIIRVLKYYEEKGIPSSIAKDTLDDLLRWIHAFKRKTGKIGFDQYCWLYNHFTGRIFHLGRLQFELKKFTDKIIVYQHNSNDNIIVYSNANIRYRQDGQIDGTSGIFDKHNGWITQLIKKDGKICGNPIDKNASCCEEMAEIIENEWHAVLAEGDIVLNVHIPEGSKLDHALCVNSYKEALIFFHKYFPSINLKAFICESWLLDIQLKKILDNNSNIVQFLNDFFLFPVYSPKEAQGYERIFGEYFADVNKLPEDTFLQKAVKQYIRTGCFLRNGAGFILISKNFE